MESILKLQNCLKKKLIRLSGRVRVSVGLPMGLFVDVDCFSEISPSRHGINYVDDWPIWQQALSRPSGRHKLQRKLASFLEMAKSIPKKTGLLFFVGLFVGCLISQTKIARIISTCQTLVWGNNIHVRQTRRATC
jgi:hypothetical protein